MKRTSQWLRVERSRNARLWVTEVIMPILYLTTAVLIVSPKARETVVNTGKKVKTKYQSIFKKEETTDAGGS